MNRFLNSLKVTAEEIGHCLLCGGEHGNCTCTCSDIYQPAPPPRKLTDLRQGEGNDECSWFLCPRCKTLIAAPKDMPLVRCGECSYAVRLPARKIAFTEYNPELINVSGLSRRARRKPSLNRARA